MFGLLILLCSPMQCISATTPEVYATEFDCQMAAEIIKRRGLDLIDRGEIIPHTFQHTCVAWGNPL